MVRNTRPPEPDSSRQSTSRVSADVRRAPARVERLDHFLILFAMRCLAKNLRRTVMQLHHNAESRCCRTAPAPAPTTAPCRRNGIGKRHVKRTASATSQKRPVWELINPTVFRSRLRGGVMHGQIKKVLRFTGRHSEDRVHGAMGVSAYALAKALGFPVSTRCPGRPRHQRRYRHSLGKYFGLPAQFWLNLQNDYDLRIAEGSGIGKALDPQGGL